MYNGIGLTTPRGSGTNGYVQRNLANVSVKKYEDFKPVDSKSHAIFKKPNKEILEHERKRKIELKCVELEDLMERQGYSQEEIDKKVNLYRDSLMEKHNEQMKGDGGATIDEFEKDAGGRIKGKGTHEEALANSLKDKKFKEAMHITSDDEKNTNSIFDKSVKVVQKRKVEDEKSEISEDEKPKKKKSKKSKKSKLKNKEADDLSIDESSDDDKKKKKSKKSRKHKKKNGKKIKKMKRKHDSIDSIESGQISESGPSRMNSHDQKDAARNITDEKINSPLKQNSPELIEEEMNQSWKDQNFKIKEVKVHEHNLDSRRGDDEYRRRMEERDRLLDNSRRNRTNAQRSNERELRKDISIEDTKMLELGSSERESKRDVKRDDFYKSLEAIPSKECDNYKDEMRRGDRNIRQREGRCEDRILVRKEIRHDNRNIEKKEIKQIDRNIEDSRHNFRDCARDESKWDGGRDEIRRDGYRDEIRRDGGRDEIRRDGGRDENRRDGARDEIRRDGGRDENRRDNARDEIRRDGGRDENRRDSGRDENRRDGARDENKRDITRIENRRVDRNFGRDEIRNDDRTIRRSDNNSRRDETRREERQVGRNEIRRDDRTFGRDEGRRDERTFGRDEGRRDERRVGKDDRRVGREEIKRADKNIERERNIRDDRSRGREEQRQEKIKVKKEDFEESNDQPFSYRIHSLKEKEEKLKIYRSEKVDNNRILDTRVDSRLKKKSLSLSDNKPQSIKKLSRSPSSSSSSSYSSSSSSDSSSSSSV